MTSPSPSPTPSRDAFTSDLSIDEAVLLDEVGFEPVDFVMGSSFYHIGYTMATWSDSEEMVDLTAAMMSARHLAMGRLVEQATRAGADGVVGMRIEVDHHEHHAEFVAMGTAVRARTGNYKVSGKPFTSDLSGQDFWALLRAGYRPCAMVMGSCVYHVAHQSLGAWIGGMGNNREMPNFTQALYEARELAMGRMQAEATQAGASGVVGVNVSEGSYSWHSHIIEFLSVGTAIARIPMAGPPRKHEPITAVLGMRDGK